MSSENNPSPPSIDEWQTITSEKHDNIECHSGILVSHSILLSKQYKIKTNEGDMIPIQFAKQLKPFENKHVHIEGYFDTKNKKFIVLRIKTSVQSVVKKEVLERKELREKRDYALPPPPPIKGAERSSVAEEEFTLEFRTKKPTLTGTLDGDKELIISGKSMDTSCAYNKDF